MDILFKDISLRICFPWQKISKKEKLLTKLELLERFQRKRCILQLTKYHV
jgi:hypothetical protein